MKLRQPRPMPEDADMSRVEVRPFEAADVPASGALLAERHRRHRKAHPLLSPRFETVEVVWPCTLTAIATHNVASAPASSVFAMISSGGLPETPLQQPGPV